MKLVVGTFLTLDGIMQGPGGPEEDRSGGFDHGGWLVPHFDDMMGQVMDDWIQGADGLLLGRKTYQIFAAHWPYVTGDDPIARKFNSVRKHVVSRTLDRVDWNNSTLIKGDAVEAITRIKDQPGAELQVHGSGDLIQTLLEHDLVDQFRLWIFPVVLGTGKRLFANGTTPARLELVEPGPPPPGSYCRCTSLQAVPTTGRLPWSSRQRPSWSGGERSPRRSPGVSSRGCLKTVA
jgi:dihydrofolate reductase